MFTGLIQKVGKLESIRLQGDTGVLALHVASWDSNIEIGESIAVQGVCLTVTAVEGAGIQFDILKETLDKTALREKKSGDLLNLERALRPIDRLGGHFVTGHIDGTGIVKAVNRAGRDWVLEIAIPESMCSGFVPKGSVALDGISLTVAELKGSSFGVHIIPHTWAETSLVDLKAGAMVNIETDILGKYVKGYLNKSGEGKVTWDKLKKAGFM